jgi:hypothetical protein
MFNQDRFTLDFYKKSFENWYNMFSSLKGFETPLQPSFTTLFDKIKNVLTNIENMIKTNMEDIHSLFESCFMVMQEWIKYTQSFQHLFKGV